MLGELSGPTTLQTSKTSAHAANLRGPVTQSGYHAEALIPGLETPRAYGIFLEKVAVSTSCLMPAIDVKSTMHSMPVATAQSLRGLWC